MEEFVREWRKDIEAENVKEGDYCILVNVYKGSQIHQSGKRVKFIYKTIDEFEARFKLEDIESSYGVETLLWIFD